MKLEGSITTFPIRELIEMTVYSSVTGVLNLYWPQGEGHLYFRDGQPYHAVSGTMGGIHAVALLFEQTQANFCFVADSVAEEETLWGDSLALSDSAEQLAARWRRIRHVVPDVRFVPRVAIPPEAARARLSIEHWSLYEAIDGVHTLEDISHLLNWELIEICEAIVPMCTEGLVSLRPPNGVARRVEPRQPVVNQTSPQVKAGVLDRLLGGAPTAAPPVPGVRTAPAPPAPPASPPAAAPNRTPQEDAILRVLRG